MDKLISVSIQYECYYWFVASIFTRIQGSYVWLNDTIAGFSLIVTGDLDVLSEGWFYLKGAISDITKH